MELPKQTILSDQEFIKLSKMSKGYNWELKILEGENGITLNTIKRLEDLNTEMMKKFGSLEA